MADRYWVGGAGTWDATTTTNWSATSGGAGGASAPTSADNVIFNTLSNATAYAVTVGTNANAQDITIAGPAVGNVTITSGATAVINCYGSWTSAATGVVFTTTSGAIINFLATTTGKTITTNNVTLGAMAVILSGVGGEWSLGSAFTITANFTVTSGTFTTTASNYALNALRLLSSSVNVRSISFNASIITVSGPTAVDFTTTTNLTFNAGTSTLIGTNSSSTLAGGAQTFYNVTFAATVSGTTTIIGANTFNVLTQAAISAAGLRFVLLSANQTIATLTLSSGASAVTRTFVVSNTIGTQRTLTVATLTAISDVDFRDIVAAGASGTWSGTRLGDCKNNSNITFGAGVTKYLSTVSGVNATWSGTSWATSTGGTPALNNFPLAQDTCIIDNSGATVGDGLRTGNTVTIDFAWNMGTLNFSGRTVAFNWFQGNSDPFIYGDVTLTTAMTMTTVTGTPTWTFANQGTVQALDSAGLTIRLSQLIINSPSGGVSLTTNTTVDLSPIIAPNTLGFVNLIAGTLILNSNTLTTTVFVTSSTTAHTLAFGTGNITLTGTGTVYTGSTTTTVTGTPQVICTDSSAAARTITSGAVTEANSISFRITAGTGTLSLTTTGAVRNLDFTDGTNPTGYGGALTGSTTNTVYGDFKASTNMTGASGSGVVTFAATSGTKTIDTAGVTFDRPFTFNGVGGTFQLASALTSGATRTVTLTSGTLDLNGYTLTTGIYAGTGSAVRSLLSSSVPIVITGNAATVIAIGTTTNFTADVAPIFNLNYSGSVGTRTITYGALTSTTIYAPNINVTAGSDIVTTGGTTTVGNLNFTGFTGTFGNATRNIYGNLTLVSGMATPSSGSLVTTFNGVSAQTITTASQTLDFPITFDGIGGTWEMQDALTLGSTRTLTLNNGTLDLNGFTLTTGLFSSNNSNVRTLAFGTGKLVITGTNTGVWSTSTSTNLTMTGSRTVEVTGIGLIGETRVISSGSVATGGTDANAANFYIQAGADSLNIGTANRVYGTLDFTGFSGTTIADIAPIIYGNLVLSSTMTLSPSATNAWIFAATTPQTITTNGKTILNPITFNGIGGTWTMQDALTLGSLRTLTMTNGTLKLKSGTTSTVGAFATSGTNQKYLYATTSGTQATISDASGTNSVDYLTIQDSNATGGALFQAFTSNFNVDAGNNTGWKFSNNGGTFLVFF
jgi:hypothetical protein